jgi:inner membrane protein
VDALTHGLASFALTRTFFPRVSRTIVIGSIIAGTIADVDLASEWMGPSAFLAAHRTFTHSLLGALAIAAISAMTIGFLLRRHATQNISVKFYALPVFLCVFFHLLMDYSQSDGVALLWPFRMQRFSADWIAHMDLWILVLLLCGVLLPRLFGLVSTEIGAKAKGPKGQVGAAAALVILFFYVGARMMLHGNAIAELDSRTYRGEPARRWAALPDSASPFRWHGIVETERALHDLRVDVVPGASFDADSGITTYKPETSAALDAARDTATARKLLAVARFPRANVEKTATGFRIEIQGFPYRNDSSAGLQVRAEIDTDANGVVRGEEILWAPNSR